MIKNKKLKLAFLAFIVCWGSAFSQGNAKFKVMLDPGHGGQDPGAGYYGVKEKDVVLSVALKLGKLLEKEGVQVNYTRKTDVFIELDDRCDIANKAEANLFISIHCNGEARKKASGVETYVMGPTKNAMHLEVAKKENSVINFENDKQKYQGFDPNKPETLIGLTLLNEEAIRQSIDLAMGVQKGFKAMDRKDRGVKQAPFWVLHRTAMPSILIELGFLSYKPEGEFLNSGAGQDELARAIAKAVTAYRQEYFTGGGEHPVLAVANEETPEPATRPVADKPVKPTVSATSVKKGESFRVQIATGKKDLALTPSNFKGLRNISKEKGRSVIQYFYGETTDREKAKTLLAEAKAKGYSDAIIATFRDGKKI